jgi:outer membrane lipoprotein-sorting protein
MKNIFLTLIMISTSILTYHNAKAQDDTKATTILNAASTKMKSYTTMKLEFTYSMVNTKTKVNETKAGIIQVKGDKYKLDMGGQSVFCDGKTIWTYIKDDNECNINSVSTQEDAMNPLAILNNYAKNFKPKFIKDMVQGGKNYQIVDLTPLKTKNYYKVRLAIDKATSQVGSIVVFDKNGSTYTYLISKFTTNTPMADTIFTFVATNFPGVEVNDMR